ncbi:hypothetical protein D3C72_1838250 [compost metagenome]
MDAKVVLQDRARPHDRGELVLRNADAAALHVLGTPDTILAHVDGGVAERPREKDGHCDVRTVAARMLDQVARERQLADIEVLAAHGAEEHFLRVERHVDGIDAVDLDAAIEQRAGTVIVAHGDGEAEFGHR